MAFFDDIGNAADAAARHAAQAAKNAADRLKLKGAIEDERKRLDETYAALGRLYYEKHKASPDVEFIEQFKGIASSDMLISNYTELMESITDYDRCPECGAEHDPEAKACSECGHIYEAPEEQPDEVPDKDAGEFPFEPASAEEAAEENAADEAAEAEPVSNEEANEERVLEEVPAAFVHVENRCANCGAPLLNGARFCTVCGTLASIDEEAAPAQPEETPAAPAELPRLCIKCGAVLKNDSRFCTSCGAVVPAEEAPVFVPEPAPEPIPVPISIPVPEPAPAAPVCAGCGAPLREGSKFCTACGMPVPEEPKTAAIEDSVTVAPSPEAIRSAVIPPVSPVHPISPIPAAPAAPEAPHSAVSELNDQKTAVIEDSVTVAPSPELMHGVVIPAAAPAPVQAPKPEPAEEPKRLCPFCGAEMVKNTRFCISCGERVAPLPNIDTPSKPSADDAETVAWYEPAVQPAAPAPEPVKPAPAKVFKAPEKPAPAFEGRPSRCINCGAEINPGAKFCVKCGTLVPSSVIEPAPAPERLCTVCGAKLKEGQKFCVKCGARTE